MLENKMLSLPLLLLPGMLLLALSFPIPAAMAANQRDSSLEQTIRIFEQIGCLTEEERQFGRQILTGLNYTDQRIFRRMCRLPGIDFIKAKKAWTTLLELNLSYEQTLTFEAWSRSLGISVDLAIASLQKFKTLSYEAGRAFRAYLQLKGVTPRQALETIPLLTSLKDPNNRAIREIFAIREMTAAKALDSLVVVARLKPYQAAACEAFAHIRDMTLDTMLDGLALIQQLREDDAWNSRNLFRQQDMNRSEAWLWLVRYFALPPEVQEAQYYLQDIAHKKALLKAFYDGGEELIWKINNLHAITDRFGFEISSRELLGYTRRQLLHRFEQLSRQTKFVYGKRFYPLFSSGRRHRMIAVLRQATAADRQQIAKDLVSANIYALLAQGSELYDSSFRDILVPILKKRIMANHEDDLLKFIQAIDPENMLVANFIVSLAQKGKLTTFFPDDPQKQQDILELVASSAFKDEDAILLFSATFMHLLHVLEPDSRTFLIKRMIREVENHRKTFSRLITVILQYYLQEYPELLSTRDRALIVRLTVRQGAIDLGKYQRTPFAEWKKDHRLGSISVFHPDDDGRKSFISNGRTLMGSGYQPELCEQYTIRPLTQAKRLQVDHLLAMIRTHPVQGLKRLFSAMHRDHFAVDLVKTIKGITIRHALYVYGGEQNQEKLLERFLRGGDEMFAQRGHSYWRSEQITDPLLKLLREHRINASDLEGKQRFLSLGSCGGVKAYTRLTRIFRGHVDILATIGTGMAMINNPYNKNFFEVVARNPSTISWKDVALQSAFIFAKGRGQDYLQPGSLTAILHKLLDDQKKQKNP